MPARRALVVDDNAEMATTIATYLGRHGFEAEAVDSGTAAIACCKRASFDVVLTDLRMQDLDGLDVLDAVHQLDPTVPVVIMTAFGAIDSAVEAIRRGAYNYVTKPFKLEVVRLLLERATTERAMRSENEVLRRTVREQLGPGSMVGKSAAIRRVFELIQRVAMAASPVLVRGETGSGKELVAKAIHDQGPRAAQPFVAVNCAAVPEALLESELFGHARGAFTGATQLRRGLFVEAHGGTLLLDEIGDMALALQAKLLRVIETGEIRAVGSDSPRKVDVRIIAATHQDLPVLAREGKFRSDLFFRLNVVPVQVPALRERQEDIPALVQHFLELSRSHCPASPVIGVRPDGLRLLMEHSWPGNVRELENLVERCVVTGTEPEVSRAQIQEVLAASQSQDPLQLAQGGMMTLEQLQQRYIAWVLERVGGNKTRAAEILGIDPSTLHRREKQGKL